MTETGESRPAHRGLRVTASILGLLALPIPILLAVAALWLSASPLGWALTLATGVLVGGAISAPWRVERRRGVMRFGAGLLALSVAIHALLAAFGPVRLIRITEGAPHVVDVLGYVVDEGDLVIPASVVVGASGDLPAGEVDGLTRTLSDSYGELRGSALAAPTPTPLTLLDPPTAASFDALVLRAEHPDTS